MNFQKIKLNKVSLLLLILIISVFSAMAQENKDPIKSTMVFDEQNKDMTVAVRNNLYCGGYIQRSSFNTKLEIVGSKEEKDKNIYAEGDELYLNAGAADGVKVGDKYSVIRPRGKFKSEFTKKKDLGVYVQELGSVEVFKVMRDVSVARVNSSCGIILFGDLLTPVPTRQSPMFKKRAALDEYAPSTGKAQGRIMMARDQVELLGREQIVYVDLGREDSVQVGDYMTIFRKLGSGDLFSLTYENMADNKKEEYGSERYKGGVYSNQAPRSKGSEGNGGLTNAKEAKSRRPEGLRRVVGELIVLNVLEKTATAMIVRNASEIHTGDHVELQ